MLDDIEHLDELWAYCDALHSKHFPNTKLKPIMGGGKSLRPKYMFVFINPTYRNISSGSGWDDFRAPWIGTKNIWRIFHRAGHFDTSILKEIEAKKEWNVEFANKVYGHLEDRGFYFTNLVKWTGENADLPTKQKVDLFLPILKREVELVRPKKIVTFGLMPFEALTRRKIRLEDYYEETLKSGRLVTFDSNIIPCYFPVGRGNPKRAIEILKLL